MPKDKSDMGPFAGMDSSLEAAITSYGTPPHREIIRVSVRDVGHYSFDDLPKTLPGWQEWLAEARADTPEEYRDHLNCILHWEPGYYDSGDSASFDVWYERPETDAEMTDRVNRGIVYVQNRQNQERATYEALKKKFEVSC